MLLLCVCWWSWCDVDPTILLLLLELVELLLGLGVAIVVLNSSSSAQAAMQRVKLRPLCLQTGHCATWTQRPQRRPRLCCCCFYGQSEIANHDFTVERLTCIIKNIYITHSGSFVSTQFYIFVLYSKRFNTIWWTKDNLIYSNFLFRVE